MPRAQSSWPQPDNIHSERKAKREGGLEFQDNRGQAEGIEEESTQTGARLCREDVGLCRPNSPEIDQA